MNHHSLFGSADPVDETSLDPRMDAASQAFADALSTDDIALIDRKLLSHSVAHWRKSARVAASCLMELPEELKAIHPDFLSGRIKHLIDEGRLIHQGDLNRLRFCEIRLSSSDPTCF